MDGKITVKRNPEAIEIGLVQEDDEVTAKHKKERKPDDPVKVYLKKTVELPKVEAPPEPAEFVENKKTYTRQRSPKRFTAAEDPSNPAMIREESFYDMDAITRRQLAFNMLNED